MGLLFDLRGRDCETVNCVTYLDEIAAQIQRQVSRDLLPEEDVRSLFRLYALLALVKGRFVTAADVHNAWAAWMLEIDPKHRSIKPFSDLDAETKQSDEPYVTAIRSVVEDLGLAGA